MQQFSCSANIFLSQTVDEKFIEEEKKFRGIEKTVKVLWKNISTYLAEFRVKQGIIICYSGLGPVARRMVYANHWLRSIKTYTFLW